MHVAVYASDPLMRSALAALLVARAEVGHVSEAPDLRTLTAQLHSGSRQRGCVLAAPREDVPEAVRDIDLAHRDVPIVALLPHPVTAQDVRATVSAGADGVMTVAASADDLIHALTVVRDGQSYIHPALGALLAHDDGLGPVERLSPREREVLRMIGLGMTTPEIADALVVSPRTVETHRARLVRKLQAGSRSDLVRHALRSGLVGGG